MMDRPDQYVVVGEALWDKYQRSHGVERKLLHVRIFYSGFTVGAPEGASGACSPSCRYVLHPMLVGPIPQRHAVGERFYRDETRNAHRSQREIDRTRSMIDKWALS